MLEYVYTRNPVGSVNSILLTSVIDAFRVKTLFEAKMPRNRLDKNKFTGAIVESVVPEFLAFLG